MGKKKETVFVCQECGSESSRWTGQCPVCHAWNSLVEEKVFTGREDDRRRRTSATAAPGRPQKLAEVS